MILQILVLSSNNIHPSISTNSLSASIVTKILSVSSILSNKTLYLIPWTSVTSKSYSPTLPAKS